MQRERDMKAAVADDGSENETSDASRQIHHGISRFSHAPRVIISQREKKKLSQLCLYQFFPRSHLPFRKSFSVPRKNSEILRTSHKTTKRPSKLMCRFACQPPKNKIMNACEALKLLFIYFVFVRELPHNRQPVDRRQWSSPSPTPSSLPVCMCLSVWCSLSFMFGVGGVEDAQNDDPNGKIKLLFKCYNLLLVQISALECRTRC